MTTLGGLGHTLPYLIPQFHIATAIAVAIVIVIAKLGLIAWVRKRYMDTSFGLAVLQVIVGGALVFTVGVLIGNA